MSDDCGKKPPPPPNHVINKAHIIITPKAFPEIVINWLFTSSYFHNLYDSNIIAMIIGIASVGFNQPIVKMEKGINNNAYDKTIIVLT